VCCLNGAAAHLVNEGDEVIIASYRYVDIEAEEKQFRQGLSFSEKAMK
jgi:aspartate 1-decarboxylase